MISMAGIGLGVAALIVVLSVMNGFQKELRTRILGVASHIQVTGIDGGLDRWQSIAAGVEKHPEVRATAPFVQSQGMFSVDGEVKGALIRGIVPELDRITSYNVCYTKLLRAVACLAVGVRCLPELRSHLGQPGHPLTAALDVLREGNHLRALLFSALMIFAGFTVIPYITIQSVGNVGITQAQIP